MKSLDYHTIKHNISKSLKEAKSKPLTHKYIISRFHIRFILFNNAFRLFVWVEILTHKIREISQRFIKCMYQSRKMNDLLCMCVRRIDFVSVSDEIFDLLWPFWCRIISTIFQLHRGGQFFIW